VRIGLPAIDVMTSLLVSTAALTALRVRDETGEGQRIEISLLDALVHAQASGIGPFLTAGFKTPRTGNRSLYFAPSGIYPTRDGKNVVITTPAEKFFGKLCRALEVSWDEEPRFRDINSRLENEDALDELIAERTKQFDRDELVERLIAADVLTAPINEVEEVVKDPQILHNQMIVTTQHATLGEVDVTGVPIRFYGTPGSVRSAPPLQGQHTLEFLKEVGCSEAEIESLMQEGVAATFDDIQSAKQQRAKRRAEGKS
jgi:crotonobetainyl-CoA:carnitine CoA-transferase CaiB-like acyl-CoA transferase